MAQTRPSGKDIPYFFFAPLAEVSLNNAKDSPSFGGGFIVGADGVVALGLSCLYLYEVKNSALGKRIDSLEVTVFLRVYIYQPKPKTGLFVQFNFGPVLYFAEDDWSIPAVAGACSAGLLCGWRIPVGNVFYIEPVVRGGYPYIVSGGLSLGFRF